SGSRRTACSAASHHRCRTRALPCLLRLSLGTVALQHCRLPFHPASLVQSWLRRETSLEDLQASERDFPSLLTPLLPLFPRLLQFLIAPRPDRLGAAFQFVEWRDVADRAVQTNPIVMIDVAGQQAPRLLR